jgi:sec-independent protein translocase protein TatC
MTDVDALRERGVSERLPVPTGSEPPSPTPNTGSPKAAPDTEKVMTLVDHLGELRTRVVRSIIAVAVGSAVGFYAAPDIRRVIIQLLPSDQVQILGPGDAFAITLRISVVVGIILAMPVLLYQMWAFVAPGLTAAERRVLRPWVPLALGFFALGVTIAWFVLPFAISFLLQFTDEYITAEALAAGPYFDFVTTLFLAFGLVLEFPIVLYALSRVGIATSARLRASRRIVILVIAVFAALATPGGDIVSPLVLGGTMYALFELTVLAIRRSGR